MSNDKVGPGVKGKNTIKNQDSNGGVIGPGVKRKGSVVSMQNNQQNIGQARDSRTMPRVSSFSEIGIYFGKCFRIFVHEKQWTSIIFAGIIVLVISWVSGDKVFETFSNTRSGMFALICGCIWIGVFNSIQSICRERDIIKREHRTGMRISSYLFAHFYFEAIICFVQSILVFLIFIILRGLPSDSLIMPSAITFFITFFLVILASDILGIMISSIVKTASAASTVMPFILIAQMVLCGIIFKLDGLSEYLGSITISKWGITALCVISNVNSMGGALSDLREDYLFSEAKLLLCWGILLLFIVICFIGSIIALSFVDKDKR